MVHCLWAMAACIALLIHGGHVAQQHTTHASISMCICGANKCACSTYTYICMQEEYANVCVYKLGCL